MSEAHSAYSNAGRAGTLRSASAQDGRRIRQPGNLLDDRQTIQVDGGENIVG